MKITLQIKLPLNIKLINRSYNQKPPIILPVCRK